MSSRPSLLMARQYCESEKENQRANRLRHIFCSTRPPSRHLPSSLPVSRSPSWAAY